MHNSSAVAFGF